MRFSCLNIISFWHSIFKLNKVVIKRISIEKGKNFLETFRIHIMICEKSSQNKKCENFAKKMWKFREKEMQKISRQNTE